MNSLIYVADDDPVNLRMVQAILEKEGYIVQCFETGDQLYETFLQKKCDLAILDVIMPGNDGFSISAKILQVSKLPVIVLTGQESDEDYVFGISLGLDAYLTKPANPAKLVAHVKTLLRKAEGSTSFIPLVNADIVYANITIDPNQLEAFVNGEKLPLTNTEFNLLKFMLINRERAISREELLSKVWRHQVLIGTRTIDDALKRLRRKLADAGSKVSIDTVRGYGFRVGLLNGQIILQSYPNPIE